MPKSLAELLMIKASLEAVLQDCNEALKRTTEKEPKPEKTPAELAVEDYEYSNMYNINSPHQDCIETFYLGVNWLEDWLRQNNISNTDRWSNMCLDHFGAGRKEGTQ